MIVINGAGIAGLTLANALQQRGMAYLLIEQAPELQAIGAGIVLQNNGLAILQALGLLPRLKGFEVQHVFMGQGKQHRSVNAAKLGVQCNVVHRADLQQLLLAPIPASNIKTGCRIIDVQQQTQQVQLRLSDQSQITADYVIDAAGIHSALNKQPVLKETQTWCWRSIVDLKQPITASGEYWFGKHRIGLAPISEQQAYLYHVIKLDVGETAQSFSQAQRQQWIQQQAEQIELLQAVQFKASSWLSHPLQDRQIHWGDHRIIQIGDSAHAMTPNLGQGAVLAMEDAITLAQILYTKNQDPLKALMAQRHRRIKTMHRMSRLVGWLAHTESTAMIGMKWMMFRFMPLKLTIANQVHWMNQFIKQLKMMTL